jgi:predicted permease
MRQIFSDVRYALRTLRAAPLFTVLTGASIALGIGANTTIFTLLDQIVLRPLPIERPDQLVQLRIDGEFDGNTWGDGSELSYPMYIDLRDHNAVFSGVCARFEWQMHLSAGGSTERVNGELVSGTYFPTLRVAAIQGRLIAPDDDRHQGGQPVAVLSASYWRRRFAANPDVVGRKISLNGHPFTVIGVARDGFTGIDVGYATDVWAPMMMKPQMTPGWNALDDRRSRFARIFARLRSGISAEQAEASLQPYFKTMRREELKDPAFTTASATFRRAFLQGSLDVVPAREGRSGLREWLMGPLWTLMAIVAGVLLIACANVAGLLVARGMSRQREMAIRLALGGSRMRVIRQLVIESVVLALIGSAAGLLVATWGTSFLLAVFLDPGATYGTAIGSSPDSRILGFNFGIALIAGVLFGLVPAIQATRPALALTLREQSGSVLGGGPVRLRKVLVVGQVALSLLLLASAGLFVRSLRNLMALDPGFEVSHLVQFAVDPSLNAYKPEQAKRLAIDLIARLSAVPGVTSASMAGIRILDGGSWNSSMTVEGYRAKEGQPILAFNNTVMPRYFATLGIPLIAGRDFTDADAKWTAPKDGEPGIVIANRRFVDKYFAGRNPIGRHVGFGDRPGTPTPLEIVGVVGTAHYTSLRDEAEPQLFFPMLQNANPRTFVVYVRATQPPAAIYAAARQAVKALDPNLPVVEMYTMEEQIDRSLIVERMVAGLSAVLGVLATLLAVVGVYGVMAYTVTRRTREIGIRMALGARARLVAWLFLREATLLIAIGFAIGLPSLWAFGRYLESQLYGITPFDPLTVATAMIGLAVVAIVGALVPSLRAARINPLSALREE